MPSALVESHQSSPCPPSPVVLYLRMSQGSRPHPSSSFLPMPRCLCASPLLTLLYKVYHPRARPLGAHSSFTQSSIYLGFRTSKALSCPLCASFLQDSRIFLFLFLTPSLSSARKAISPSLLPFPLRSRSAPTHPSDLGSEVMSSKKSSLFPTPQTDCIILSYPHMAPCFPLRPLSHHEQIGVCGNHGVVPVSRV